MAAHIHGEPQIVGNRATVVVEGATVADVTDQAAKAAAVAAVGTLLSRPGINGSSGPYPVDPDTGRPYFDPRGGQVDNVTMKAGTRYRQDFYFMGGM